MRIAYVRVSTIEQNEARQVEALKKYNIEKWFIEKVSAKNTNRPKLHEMTEFAREGDCIYIHDFQGLQEVQLTYYHLWSSSKIKALLL